MHSTRPAEGITQLHAQEAETWKPNLAFLDLLRLLDVLLLLTKLLRLRLLHTVSQEQRSAMGTRHANDKVVTAIKGHRTNTQAMCTRYAKTKALNVFPHQSKVAQVTATHLCTYIRHTLTLKLGRARNVARTSGCVDCDAQWHGAAGSRQMTGCWSTAG